MLWSFYFGPGSSGPDDAVWRVQVLLSNPSVTQRHGLMANYNLERVTRSAPV